MIFDGGEKRWQWGGDRKPCVGLTYISDAERTASTCQQIDVENEQEEKSGYNSKISFTIGNKQKRETSKNKFRQKCPKPT